VTSYKQNIHSDSDFLDSSSSRPHSSQKNFSCFEYLKPQLRHVIPSLWYDKRQWHALQCIPFRNMSYDKYASQLKLWL